MTELVTTMEARAAPLIPEGLRARFKDALDKVAPNRIGVFAGAITAGNRYHSNIHACNVTLPARRPLTPPLGVMCSLPF
jgi:hypothetical protein